MMAYVHGLLLQHLSSGSCTAPGASGNTCWEMQSAQTSTSLPCCLCTASAQVLPWGGGGAEAGQQERSQPGYGGWLAGWHCAIQHDARPCEGCCTRSVNAVRSCCAAQVCILPLPTQCTACAVQVATSGAVRAPPARAPRATAATSSEGSGVVGCGLWILL